MTDGEEQLREQVKVLGEKFLVRTEGQITTLREQLLRVRAGDREAMGVVQELTHKIHGSGAMFGFAKISECAGELELLSVGMGEERASTPHPPYAEWAEKLTQCVGELARALEAAQQARR